MRCPPFANLPLCPPSWWSGGWSECSRSCSGGLRTRQVLCKRKISSAEDKVHDDAACSGPRPDLTQPCSSHSCPPEWTALDWSEVRHGGEGTVHWGLLAELS